MARIYTNLPLRNIFQNFEASKRLIKWLVELGEFDIYFFPRSNIKLQVLANFMPECTIPISDEPPALHSLSPYQMLYVDGASRCFEVGANIILICLQHITLEYELFMKFHMTNNIDEYETVIVRLRLAINCEL